MQKIENILEAQNWPMTFHALDTAMRTVGLTYALEGRGPITLFAPNDKAFNQLHQVTIYDLLKRITLLRKLLEYHIVPLKLARAGFIQVASPFLPNRVSLPLVVRESQRQRQPVEVPTLSGRSLLVTFSNGLRVQGTVVLQPEMEADNGIVYPMEQILWPPDIDEASFFAGRPAQSTL
jgi:uncharacterized surface protein with fasciclin (FAS1) repeats